MNFILNRCDVLFLKNKPLDIIFYIKSKNKKSFVSVYIIIPDRFQSVNLPTRAAPAWRSGSSENMS